MTETLIAKCWRFERHLEHIHISRKIIFFIIVWLFQDVYDVEKGNLVRDDSSDLGDKQIQVTPFSVWSIVIPKNSINEGIQFEENPELEITFEANCIENTTKLSQSLYANYRLLSRPPVPLETEQLAEQGHSKVMVASATPPIQANSAPYVYKSDILNQLSYPCAFSLPLFFTWHSTKDSSQSWWVGIAL